MKLKKTIAILNSVFLIIIILFTPLLLNVFNIGYYKHLYESNGIFDNLQEDQVIKTTQEIYDFFKFKIENLDSRVQYYDKNDSGLSDEYLVFTKNEIDHFRDVRSLLSKIFILYYTSIICFIILLIISIDRNISYFLKSTSITFLVSSIFLIFSFIALSILANNFSFLFERFHLTFFPYGNYVFPVDSLIITLFPFGFFYDFFIKIIKYSAIISGIGIISGIALKYISKKMLRLK